jgi:hypothetical protein
MSVLGPMFRALGIHAAFARLTHGRRGVGQVSYIWWRLVVMQIWQGRFV